LDAWLLLGRSLVAIVIIVAGASKVRSKGPTQVRLVSPIVSRWLMRALAVFEITVGTALLLTPSFEVGAAVVVLLAAFLGYTLVEIRRPRQAGCECFGAVLRERLGPWSVGRNAVLLTCGVGSMLETAPASGAERAVAAVAALGVALMYAHLVRMFDLEAPPISPVAEVTT
jgi:hypothetical protein